MVVRVSTEDVESLARAIKSQQEKINEMCDKLKVMVDDACSEINDEQKEADRAMEKCASALAKLSSRTNELSEQVKAKNSKLSTIPPQIKRKYIDKDGNERTEEVDNPEYIALQREIASLEKQLQKLKSLMNQIEAVQRQIANQSQALSEGKGQISDITSNIKNYHNNLEGISCDARKKLAKINETIEKYNALGMRHSSHGWIGRINNTMERAVRGEGLPGFIKTTIDFIAKWVVPFIRLVSSDPALPAEQKEIPATPSTEQILVDDSIDTSKKSMVGVAEDGTTIKMDFDEDSDSYGVKISIDLEKSKINEDMKIAVEELTGFFADEYVSAFFDRKKREAEELARKLGNPDE